jgi:hypothetical protein
MGERILRSIILTKYFISFTCSYKPAHVLMSEDTKFIEIVEVRLLLFLNLVGCILLRVLDQVQGFPSNATLFE